MDNRFAVIKEGENMNIKKVMLCTISAIMFASAPAYAASASASTSFTMAAAETVNVSSNSAEGFVTRLYNLILGRQPDPTGLSEWTNLLISGQSTGAEVANGFIYSKELKERNLSNESYVEILYNTFLNRPSDPAGRADWVNLLNKGMSRPYIYMGFVNSPEFGQICAQYNIRQGKVTLSEPKDQNQDVTMFIYRCYERFLGRTADDSGLNAWADALLSGRNNAKEAASGFVFSQEFKSMGLSNTDYVKTLYRGLFDREADAQGLSEWVALLDSGSSRDAVFYGFADSQEFRDLAGSFNLDNSWAGTPVNYSLSKEAFIQTLMNNRSVWQLTKSQATVYTGYFEPGYTLMDMDFDGTPELLVSSAGGTMHNNPTKVYKVTYGKVTPITASGYELDIQSPKIYFDKTTGQYIFLTTQIHRGGIQAKYTSIVQYQLSNNTVSSNTLFSISEESDTYGNKTTTYYAEDTKVSKSTYDRRLSQYMGNLQDTNMTYGFVSYEDWTASSIDAKASALGQLYDDFGYNKY